MFETNSNLGFEDVFQPLKPTSRSIMKTKFEQTILNIYIRLCYFPDLPLRKKYWRPNGIAKLFYHRPPMVLLDASSTPYGFLGVTSTPKLIKQ
ncbi:hypothetical protein T03_6591, partial [Trichinella britovi]